MQLKDLTRVSDRKTLKEQQEVAPDSEEVVNFKEAADRITRQVGADPFSALEDLFGASRGGQLAVADGQSGIADAINTIDEEFCKLRRAQRLGDAASRATSAEATISGRGRQALSDLMATSEAVERIDNNVGFALKYRKKKRQRFCIGPVNGRKLYGTDAGIARADGRRREDGQDILFDQKADQVMSR